MFLWLQKSKSVFDVRIMVVYEWLGGKMQGLPFVPTFKMFQFMTFMNMLQRHLKEVMLSAATMCSSTVFRLLNNSDGMASISG